MNIDQAMLQVRQQSNLLEQQRLQAQGKASGAVSEAEKEKLQKACQEYEAIFLNMMLKQMRGSVMEGDLTEKSHAREIFEEMHDEELSKAMSQGKGMGLARQLYQQLTATRATSPEAATDGDVQAPGAPNIRKSEE